MSRTNRTTPYQKEQIKLIERVLHIDFEGNISNQIECQLFIDEYYDNALQIYTDVYTIDYEHN